MANRSKPRPSTTKAPADVEANVDEAFEFRLNNAGEMIGHAPSALSLDGRSLIVPNYGDIDDMSSLGTSKHYRPDRSSKHIRGNDEADAEYIGNMKIVAKKVKRKQSRDTPADGDTNQNENSELSQSFEEKKDDVENDKESSCIPRWIRDAPTWLKLIIVASIALIIGALVLIVVGAKLSTSPSSLFQNQSDTPSPTPASTTPQPEVPTASTEYMGLSKVKTTTPNPTGVPTIAPTVAPSQAVSDAVSEATTPSLSNPSLSNPSLPNPSLPNPSLSNSSLLNSSLSNSSLSNSSLTNSSLTNPSLTNPSLTNPSLTNSSTTTSPILGVSTSSPTASPTITATGSPTQSPTISTVNLYLMGGRFDGEDARTLVNGLHSLPDIDGNAILVHLGDFNSPYATSCVENSFVANANLYMQSSVPVYFVPGDNEFNDCPNPAQAFGYWKQYLMGFETKYWPEPSWDIRRQDPDYVENFAFLQRDILFVGINLVGGIVHDRDEWYDRHEANLEWINATAVDHSSNYTTMVVLAHADPNIVTNDNFFSGFYPLVENYFGDKQVIYVHRNLGTDTWNSERRYNGIANLDVVAVEGSQWPPMWMQIDTAEGTYTIDQSTWHEDYIATGQLSSGP